MLISEVVMAFSHNDSFLLAGDYNMGDTVMWRNKAESGCEPFGLKDTIVEYVHHPALEMTLSLSPKI
ncbi:hypothetical protein Bhyg_09619 [Pseudolycoriella hygida]|uniref:Endonuclease/exonuclease/phosphatase domain-containing protein n=1 Tax=Pseudolycoriella hygida TaxID=35572 RepID=A0A9Q0S5Y8_9DIPT|nr:hypothetical protein Bhyg_09619 [Pseudolycoriella hygida]